MNTSKRTLFVTSALPYANGHLHLGHLVEHIQTDIWVRTHRMLGHQCMSLCGDDAHGTPIMLKAEQLHISAEELVSEMKKSHESDFQAFGIIYDHYHTTHSEENQHHANRIYERLKSQGDISKKIVLQAFDPVKNMFLPDRYVKGDCPECQAHDQYGDHCEVCGTSYTPLELKNPVSVISGATPIAKESTHLFFELSHYEDFLKTWSEQGALQTEMSNKLSEWFKEGLKPWDISRDAPYFGFPIPGETDKYFYVWLDAPIGYMAATEAFARKNGLSFDSFWGEDSEMELFHFVGKDIVYFHALFWPAMLKASSHRLPTAVFAHGFLTINGQKMSKSRGTFIEARTYLKHLSPEYLRYYFAAKLNPRVDDIDFSQEDFTNRVNADLVGKIVNIASRLSGFIHKYFEGRLGTSLSEPELYESLVKTSPEVINAYLERDYARAVRMIMEASDAVNQYIDSKKPWQLAKQPESLQEVQDVCTMGLNLFRVLITHLQPILPMMAEKARVFLKDESFTWERLHTPLLNHVIGPFEPLMQRIDPLSVKAMMEETALSRSAS